MDWAASAAAAAVVTKTPRGTVTPCAASTVLPSASVKRRVATGSGPGRIRGADMGPCAPIRAAAAAEAAQSIGGRVVLKALGHAHKTEVGAVALNLTSPDAVGLAAQRMGGPQFLVEEMVEGAVAELLVGVLRDPAHGFVMTLGAGGVLAEIIADTVSVLLPASAAAIDAALDSLRIAPLLSGYRGGLPADRAALRAAIMAAQDYAIAQADALIELEINPMIVTPDRSVAVDALIRLGDRP
jgi:acetate---CoA ligase (ADP-forming)